ncbi:hypothetical protein EDB92DRAFT_1790171 [Lactarius akahatsu]|uniref:Methyltransferase n=1 Tax=Lactarius akahatsu TaxID=416441 RepID=A0AAD4LPX0_9AGAM|nr:hypothetical protein EDB92DRAFT_1790171 [Lactarius akahatsu]
MTDSSEPRFVDTTLEYFTPPADGSKPWTSINVDPTTGERASNWEYATHAVKVENLRGRAEATLDKNGFQFFHHPAKHTSFANDEEILREYYPESTELIKQLTGASRVVLFDHTVRRRHPDVPDTPQARQPVPAVHIDQTNESAVTRVQRHLPPDDVEALLQGRFQIINLWRPIHHAAYDWPLALCDCNSIDRSRDLVSTTLKYPDHDGETYSVVWNESHRWKYVRGLTPEEGVLIKCFDSIQDGSVAVLTAHTAFEDPTTPPDAEKRESIEVRALVFYD